MRDQGVHAEKMFAKTFKAIKAVEENLEGALEDLGNQIGEIRQRIEGLNAEFFSSIFKSVT
jgi:prefoldin subunit 5